MSGVIYGSESHGDTEAVDMAACHKAMEVLQKAYPDHPWAIGCDHFAGMIHCRLQYNGAHVTNNGYGFMLRISTVQGSEGEKKLKMAGGECLERFGLARSRATDQSYHRAAQNGLDLGGIITKSRY
jgi:hypothetical protein